MPHAFYTNTHSHIMIGPEGYTTPSGRVIPAGAIVPAVEGNLDYDEIISAAVEIAPYQDDIGGVRRMVLDALATAEAAARNAGFSHAGLRFQYRETTERNDMLNYAGAATRASLAVQDPVTWPWQPINWRAADDSDYLIDTANKMIDLAAAAMTAQQTAIANRRIHIAAIEVLVLAQDVAGLQAYDVTAGWPA